MMASTQRLEDERVARAIFAGDARPGMATWESLGTYTRDAYLVVAIIARDAPSIEEGAIQLWRADSRRQCRYDYPSWERVPAMFQDDRRQLIRRAWEAMGRA